MSLPTRIGRYEIAGRLASGGMAEILLSRLTGPSGFERVVVVKRILPHLSADKTFRAMFLDEARIVARLRHPNVVQVQELGEDGSELYLAMEYLEGESLSTLARRFVALGKSMDRSLVAFVVAEACAGLHAAHELTGPDGTPLDLVHRDVSPQNVFLSYRGEVKVLDFGIAQSADRTVRTVTGTFKGKAAYASREQCLGLSLDRRTDIFALGVILYELSTNTRLFRRGSDLLTMEAICKGEVPPPSTVVDGYPLALERVCMKALARSPSDRYATAAQMRTDLLRCARDLGLDPEPAEVLGHLMRGLFQDRIAAKGELLAQVARGDEPTLIPTAETDTAVDIPIVEGTLKGSSLLTTTEVDQRRGPSRAVVALLVLVSIAGLLAAVGIVWVRTRPRDAPLAAGAQSEPPSSSAAITVTSTPSAATVFVDGESRGEAPLTLTLARTRTPVRLRLHHDGFNDVEQEVVPDVDQRLVLTLSPIVRPTATPVAVTEPAASAKPRAAPPAAKAKPAVAAPAPAPSATSTPYRRFD